MVGISPIESLDERHRRAILDGSALMAVEASGGVWQAGDPAEFFVVPIHGYMEVVRPSLDGEEVLMGLFGPGDAVGLGVCMAQEVFPATARALATGLEFLKIPSRALTLLPVAVREPWLQRLSHKHQRVLLNKIDLLAAKTVDERIRVCLAQLIERFGVWQGAGTAHLPVPLTKTQLSRLIDARVETTIRALSRWERDGINIEWGRELGIVVRDPEVLALARARAHGLPAMAGVARMGH